MSDRTSLAFGRHAFSVPKLVKRALQVVTSIIMTAAVSLVVIGLNSVLTGRGGFVQGIAAWTSFIQRPDILGTMALTAVVTVTMLYWQRGRGR